MGSPFDFFSDIFHPNDKGITGEQFQNRMTLQNTMVRNGYAESLSKKQHDRGNIPVVFYFYPFIGSSLRW